MKKALKILLYSSIILFIIFLFVSQEPTKQDEVTKVVSKKIEKIQEIPKEINQQPIINTGDDQNITVVDEGAETEDNVTINVGYWVLERVEVNNESIEYEYNKDKKIIKKMIDSNHDGKVDTVYYYDSKGRELINTYKNEVMEKKTLHKYSDDGKVKELDVIYSSSGEVYRARKTIYNERGDIAKEIVELEGLTEANLYEIEYHYNDANQPLDVVVVSKDKRYIAQKYQYKDEKLVSKRFLDNQGQISSGINYIYEDEVLKEVQDFGEFWDNSKFYNAKGLLTEETVGYGDRIKYIYDEENRLIVEKREAKEKYFFYNEDGEKIQEDHYEKDINGEFEKVSYTLFNKEKTQKISLVDDSVEITYIENFHSGQIVIHDRRDVYDRYGNLIEIWDDATGKLIEKRFYRFVVANIK